MSLRIRSVEARHGLRWVAGSLALLSRHLIGFTLLLLTTLLPALLLAAVPAIGPLLVFALGPVITLGFALASRAALAGEPPRPQHLLQVFVDGGDPLRRRRLLLLSMAYMLAVAGVFSILALGADDALTKIAEASRSDPANMAERMRAVIQEHPQLQPLILLSSLLLIAVSVLFWHAPMLVWWHGQGVAQALFSGAWACWRNKGAFLLYALGWMAATLALMAVGSVLTALLGSPQLGSLAAQPLTLLFMAAYYISTYLSFADCFDAGTASDGADSDTHDRAG